MIIVFYYHYKIIVNLKIITKKIRYKCVYRYNFTRNNLMSEFGSCYYQLYFLYQMYILSSILLGCSTNTLNDMNVMSE